MNWSNEPATENQLNRLRQFGFHAERSLTKGEAAHLIRDFEEHPEKQIGLAETGIREMTRHEAHRLRETVRTARRALAKSGPGPNGNPGPDLERALAKRQEFWIDTCREPGRMQARSPEVMDLYMKYGCRFLAPTREQVQEIFDALDTAAPAWDRDHPELFYQTLEINFRELLRHP